VRLVHGEGDWLPGLVVDEYDRCLVLQSTSNVVEQNLSVIVPWLRDRVGARSVLARNDIPTRRREGLPDEVRLLEGSRVEEVKIRENGISHVVRLFAGQKTGFYLDQRPARRRVTELAKGRRVLDLCGYQGAFSLAALAGGAREAVVVDQSESALELARQAGEDNGLGPITTHCADVFDWLREIRSSGEQFDMVILDPPAFAKSKREVENALRGYRDLNRLAMRALAPDGFLLTCSCSQNVTTQHFETVLRQAAAGLPFPLILRDRIHAGSDHPMWVAAPESEYLKVVLLHRVAQAPEPE
jgi:23S rRNA (cytosine1962-C5)-methyltransferase